MTMGAAECANARATRSESALATGRWASAPSPRELDEPEPKAAPPLGPADARSAPNLPHQAAVAQALAHKAHDKEGLEDDNTTAEAASVSPEARMPGRCRRWAKVGVPEVIDVRFEDMDTPTEQQ
jgi:hypothetical protein